MVVRYCSAFEWDFCRRLLLNHGFIIINGLRGGDGRRVVRVKVGVTICLEEFSPTWCVCLLVCVSG